MLQFRLVKYQTLLISQNLWLRRDSAARSSTWSKAEMMVHVCFLLFFVLLSVMVVVSFIVRDRVCEV